MIIVNTTFEKPPEKLATIKHQSTKPPYEYKRTNFDTTDYWLAPQRWKNGICNCESDVNANIDSDHFPLTIEVQVKLKAKTQTRREPRKKISEANEKQKKIMIS